MNAYQRWVLGIGVGFFVFSALFPPWKIDRRIGGRTFFMVGYERHFIFSPPSEGRIDGRTLLFQCGVSAIVVALGIYALGLVGKSSSTPRTDGTGEDDSMSPPDDSGE